MAAVRRRVRATLHRVLQGAASETARRVAAHRLRCARLASAHGRPGDDELLSRDVAAGVEIRESRLHGYLCRRTSFFDHVVLDALDAGVRQVVIVGAGYDGRAMRFAREHVRFFEVDHPATQSDKLARLSRLGLSVEGISFLAVDLTTDPLFERLAAGGHDRTAPSAMLVEGVASYLDEATVARTLAALRAAAAPQSRLALSVGLARRATDPALAARSLAFREAVAALGEPIRNELTVEEFADVLAAARWRRVVTEPGADGPDPSGLVLAEPAVE